MVSKKEIIDTLLNAVAEINDIENEGTFLGDIAYDITWKNEWEEGKVGWEKLVKAYISKLHDFLVKPEYTVYEDLLEEKEISNVSNS